MRSIKVYGALAKFLGKRTFKAAVNSPAEAIRFLLANFPGVRAHMAEQHYKVGVGTSELEIGNHPEHLHFPTAKTEHIRIIPVIAGAGAAGKIIAGVALIALAVVTGGIASAGVALGGFMGIGTYGTIVVGIGASLVLGGVSELLTPTQRMSSGNDSFNDPKKSYSFSGIQNTARQGVPVPIVYGECLVGSVVISAGINTEEA